MTWSENEKALLLDWRKRQPKCWMRPGSRRSEQTHDVKNLFVMNSSGFTSSACQNPTLTIMALTVRSTDYLLGEMKRGNL